MNTLQALTTRAMNGEELTFEEALWLARLEDKETLYAAANAIRLHHAGESFDLCSIINAQSGRCSENCKWCSQSKFYQTHADVYPLLSSSRILSHALDNQQAGVKKYSLVTSGRTLSPSQLKQITYIYNDLKSATSMQLCASMGLLDEEALRELYQSGVTTYHCNLETAPSFFPQLCTTHTIEEKIDTIKAAKRVGMKVCSGGIIGMGETVEHRIELFIALRELQIDSIPINFLNPIEGTPLENSETLTDHEVLTAIALARFINPKCFIRFAGGRIKYLHLQERAMKAGINAAIVGDMLTTAGVTMTDDINNIRQQGFQC